jgi:FMN-dependent NADH-azoreductase
MTTVLQINSSVRPSGSRSTQLASELASRLVAQADNGRLIERDLAAAPVHPIDTEALIALGTPEPQRTEAQRAIIAGYDALIAELQAADVIVFGVPMYNFGVPVQLKAYVDAVARAGVTFRYTASGPEGLLKNKQVYVVFARGGVHRGQPSDTQTAYMTTWLGFLGLTDVELVFAEGLDMGPEAQAQGLASARTQIAALARVPSYAHAA